MKITGFFNTLKQAKETIHLLRNEGFQNAFLDLKDEYLVDRNVITNLPGTETSTSLSELVLESGNVQIDGDKAPLTAADPMVSGIAGFDETTDYSYKIVIETDPKDERKVKDILRYMGGRTEDPAHTKK